MSKSKVLIAVDESPCALAAFEWYAEKLHRPHNEVVCFYCIQPPFIQGEILQFYPGDPLTTTAETYNSAVAACKASAKNLEDKYAEKMKAHGINGKIIAKISNSAGEAIVDKAKEEAAHYIVIGTRGLGTVRRTILGSVSDYVLHHAHCPVTVCCHAQHDDHHAKK